MAWWPRAKAEEGGLTERLWRVQDAIHAAGFGAGGRVEALRPVPRVAPEPQEVLEWGPADNAGVFGHLVAAGGILPCIIRTCNVDPFTDDAIANDRLTVEALALAGLISV